MYENHLWLGVLNSLKWEGHVLECTFCIINLDILLGVLLKTFLFCTIVLTLIYKKCARMLCFNGGTITHILLRKLMSWKVCNDVENVF